MEGLFSKPTFVVVTGSARGIGQAVAIQMARALQEKGGSGSGSAMALIDILDLSDTVDRVRGEADIPVTPIQFNMSKMEDFDDMFSKIQTASGERKYEHVILVHMVATIRYGLITDWTPKQCQDYVTLNLSAPAALIAWFVSTYKSATCRPLIISSTSRSAMETIPGTGLYPSCKMGLNKILQTLAMEHKDVTTLIYNPGFVDTPLMRSALVSDSGTDLAKNTQMMFDRGAACTPEEVAKVLLEKGLLAGKIESGSTVEYFIMSGKGRPKPLKLQK